MRLSVEWLDEYAAAGLGAEETARRLTMAGLEVEETADSPLGPVLDIKVTPNRGDCLSVIGAARELSASAGVPLKPLAFDASDGPGETAAWTSVDLQAADLCPRYAARILRNVRVGPSPAWMQARLEAAGMRPINNVVDITNYVMLETGQPLHAFDYDRLGGHRIVVRQARAGEQITTLDGIERALAPEMLVICDAERPLAVAGVMGGADSEMSDATVTVLLESAHFDGRSVRRTSRALGLRTEASYRFERIVDPAGVVRAADRACTLMAELAVGDVVPGVVDVYPAAPPVRRITIRPSRAAELLGFPIDRAQVTASLERLGFGIDAAASETATGGNAANGTAPVECVVPTWRPDIVREIDVVEEVGRVLGYEHIPERLPVGATVPGRDSAEHRLLERVRSVLVAAGLQEVVSHSLLAPTPLDGAADDDARIAIRSALSAELSGLRRSLWPGLLDALDRNARRGQAPLALFEVGKVFRRNGTEYRETVSVAGAVAGPIVAASWHRDARPIPADYYTVRGIVAQVAAALSASIVIRPVDDPRLHPGRSAAIGVSGADGTIGFMGEMHPGMLGDIHVRDRVVLFELSLDDLVSGAREGGGRLAARRFVPLSIYPAVVRDVAPRLSVDIPYAAVHAALLGAQIDILEAISLTDVYAGAPLPERTRSLTLSFTFRAADRTLSESDVNAALESLRRVLETECGATFVA